MLDMGEKHNQELLDCIKNVEDHSEIGYKMSSK